MASTLTTAALSYVWQPNIFTPSVTTLSRKSNSGLVLDISRLSTAQISKNITDFQNLELKISVDQFFSTPVLSLLTSISTKNIWVEYFSQLHSCNPEELFRQISSHKSLQCILISGDLQCIESCFSQSSPVAGLAVKGAESSGFTSSETTLSLLSHLERLRKKYCANPEIHIWGGISSPEGAAACLESGVSRIIFESLHWLTDAATGHDRNFRKQISRLRIDHSSSLELGHGLQFRAFDKGNSSAVAEIEQLKSNLNSTLELGNAISARTCSPLEAEFDGRKLVPLGPEAAAAVTFSNRFGIETVTALTAFRKETEQLCSTAPETVRKMLKGPVARLLGTRFPFIQGAMACISDIPEFALSIARAGGLPTIAMGIKPINELEEGLARLQETLQGYNYAINILTLPENPHRNEQLDWLEKNRPPFVVVSAGDPAHAVTLQKKGLCVLYVTSDIDLLQLAWNNGIKLVICEGQEAGGHVGTLSTLTLAQAALEIKRQSPKEAGDQFLILAGGIFNANSLARAAILGADAVQMGTLYLSSKEIVTSGALSPLYQKTVISSSFGDTILTGESVGLRVRALSSPKTAKIRSLEKELRKRDADESAIRHELEETSIGSLLIAARNRHPANGRPLPEDTCYREGQFMSGTIAGNLEEVVSVEDIHTKLASAEFKAVLDRNATAGAAIQISEQPPTRRERIAITGMAMTNSLGNSPEEVWQACLGLQSGISTVPADRWDHDEILQQGAVAKGKTYCRVGAFLSLDISRKELGIPPHDFQTMTSSTKLTLWLAQNAINNSQIADSSVPRHRIGVFVSQNAGEMGSTVPALNIFTKAKAIADTIRQAGLLSPGQNEALEKLIRSSHLAIDDTTLLGRLNSAAAGFICNKYAFTGPSYSVTSACASSLTALYNGVQLIQNGVLDAAVVGGGEELLIQGTFIEFSALGALAGNGYDNSDPAAFSRPFDAERSGMVLGEGGGMIVIERESVAKKRGAPILAYITGAGASNNHQGMVEAVAETQKIAISTSFREAGYGPDEIDMVECHATSTSMGDREEVKALKELFHPEHPVVLTSFKSQIGHTLGASGINSLIRGICAMQDGIFPPTLNYTKPDPNIGLEEAGFRVCREPEPWPEHPDRPRRFEVNAFGFGGANYVVQIEGEHPCCKGSTAPADIPVSQSPPATDRDLLSCGVSFFKGEHNRHPVRIAVMNRTGTVSGIQKDLAPYIQNLGALSARERRELKKLGIMVTADRPESPPLALLFSGQGSHYPQMGKALHNSFPVIRHQMNRLADLMDFDLQQLFSERNDGLLQKTEYQQPALFLLEYALFQQFKALGLHPAAMAGHSMGELTALSAAGCFSCEDGFRLINKRAQCMAKASTMVSDPGAMLAVSMPPDELRTILANSPQLFITNFNSPEQTVVGGEHQAILQLKEKLDRDAHWNLQLPVSMAFHSPTMRIIRDEFEEFLDTLEISPPQIPVLSNVNSQPYPDDSSQIKNIILSHLESPVHWQDNILSLVHDFGCRDLLEIGPRDTLCSLARECTPHVDCLNSSSRENEVETFRETIAALYVKGHISTGAAQHISLSSDTVPHSSTSISREAVLNIIRREIYSFALHGTEKFLKPAIVRMIRQELDPTFSSESLAEYMPDSILPAQAAAGSGNNTLQKQERSPVDNTVLEQIIHIIMDATGYERNEIDAGMDLRNDLAIKSSRIPIIVDEAEKQFNISATLEDFLAVKTVQDLADRVTELMEASPEDNTAAVSPSPPPTEQFEQSALQSPEAFSGRNTLEEVIRIIMDATGYERDEIEAGMDLRNDLAIKSSRIPIIVDAAEKKFNFRATLEDFLAVRTVQDLADRVDELMEDPQSQGSQENTVKIGLIHPTLQNTPDQPVTGRPGINRFIYQLEELIGTDRDDLPLAADSRILLLSLSEDVHIHGLTDSFTRRYGGEIRSIRVDRTQRPGSMDTYSPDQAIHLIQTLSDEAPLSGIILISDAQTEEQLSPQDISSLTTGLFSIFQSFLQTAKKQFCIHIHMEAEQTESVTLLGQAILGLFLSAAKEYKTVHFRSMTTTDHNDHSSLLSHIFNRSIPSIELLVRNGTLYTFRATRRSLSLRHQPSLQFKKSDVIVISGGGHGITSCLAHAIAPCGCTLVLLGRTHLDGSVSYTEVPDDSGKKQQFISTCIAEKYGDLPPREREEKQQSILTGIEIQKNIAEMEQLGATVNYFSCDITKPEEVAAMMATVSRRFGAVSGLIHGAGIIRDSFIPLIQPAAFKEVMDVKILGMVNLLTASNSGELRFAAALSSIAAVYGSVGQSNYCAANRAMAAFCRKFQQNNPATVTKVFWLPPIEGAGMAESPEIKDILQQNMGENVFLEVHEAAEIMVSELSCGPVEDCWVIPNRDSLQSETILIDPVDNNRHWFSLQDMPMLDTLLTLDLRNHRLHATRTLSSQRDPWLADHIPAKSLRFPIMSAIMAIESFLEAAHILFPWLQLNRLRNIQFLKMIECPPETDTDIHIIAHAEEAEAMPQICTISIKHDKKVLPEAAAADMDGCFQAQVLADTSRPSPGRHKIDKGENSTIPPSETEALYRKFSRLQNRYQLLHSIISLDTDTITGKMFYPEVDDFSGELQSIFHYPHYLLEALMQISLFFTTLASDGERRASLPAAIDSITFTRNCQTGEELFLYGQLQRKNHGGSTWNVRGVDSRGFIIMELTGLHLIHI